MSRETVCSGRVALKGPLIDIAFTCGENVKPTTSCVSVVRSNFLLKSLLGMNFAVTSRCCSCVTAGPIIPRWSSCAVTDFRSNPSTAFFADVVERAA